MGVVAVVTHVQFTALEQMAVLRIQSIILIILQQVVVLISEITHTVLMVQVAAQMVHMLHLPLVGLVAILIKLNI